jgi:hypothetical protein
MKSNIEIFDKDGKALDIAIVISRFIVEKADEYNLKTEEVGLYFECSSFEVARIDTEDYAHQQTLETHDNINGL